MNHNILFTQYNQINTYVPKIEKMVKKYTTRLPECFRTYTNIDHRTLSDISLLVQTIEGHLSLKKRSRRHDGKNDRWFQCRIYINDSQWCITMVQNRALVNSTSRVAFLPSNLYKSRRIYRKKNIHTYVMKRANRPSAVEMKQRLIAHMQNLDNTAHSNSRLGI